MNFRLALLFDGAVKLIADHMLHPPIRCFLTTVWTVKFADAWIEILCHKNI